MSFITRAIGAIRLASKANAPTIMVIAGIGSMTVGTVLACKQTLDLEDRLTPHADKLGDIARAAENDTFTKEAVFGARLRVYTKAALDMTHLYAVPAACLVGGIGLVVGGHKVMLKRNATLAVAYAGLQQAFDKYRQRVVGDYGQAVDSALYGGTQDMTVVDEVTGEEVAIQSRNWDEAREDIYNRVFEQGASEMWQPDLSVNRMFLDQQRRFAQQRLGQQGHLYLSDVYDALGFPETDISRVVGWKVRRNPDGTKDIPAISFGLDKTLPDDWKYNREKAIYLDFNCQGLIVGGKLQKILEKA